MHKASPRHSTNLLRRTVSCCVAMFSLATTTTAQEHGLRWNLKPGQSIDYELAVVTDVATKITEEEEVVEDSQSQDKHRIDFRWQVEKIDDSGGATIRHTFRHWKRDLRSPRDFDPPGKFELTPKPGEKIDLTKPAGLYNYIVNSEFDLKLSTRGEILEFSMNEKQRTALRDDILALAKKRGAKVPDDPDEKELKQQDSQLDALIRKITDKWTGPMQLLLAGLPEPEKALPSGNWSQEITSALDHLQGQKLKVTTAEADAANSSADGIRKLSKQVSYDFDPKLSGGPFRNGDFDRKSQRGSGTIHFNATEGRLESARVDDDFSFAMDKGSWDTRCVRKLGLRIAPKAKPSAKEPDRK